MSIIIFIAVLVILILVHEFGHFTAAKALGMRVDEFGVGFPPNLLSIKKGETKYSINAIPLGGFVSIFGEDSEEDIKNSPDKKRAFSQKPRWAQAIVLFAGVFFNFLFAWLLFSIVFSFGIDVPGNYTSPFGEVTQKKISILQVLEGAPAEKAGLKQGDMIKSISYNGKVLGSTKIENVTNFIEKHGEDEIKINYEREGKDKTAFLTPTVLEKTEKDQPAMGAMLSTQGKLKIMPPLSFLEGARFTGLVTYKITVLFGNLIANAFTGEANLSSVAGPVGIVGFVSKAYQAGFIALLNFVALISVNLAIINLVPFPALDGGRLFMLAIEGIRRKSLNPKFMKYANLIGFALLILLMIVVTYNDIIRLIGD